MSVGDEVSDGRVAIELENSGFNYLAHFGVNAYRVAVGFVFRFHNNTTEEILFRYNEDSVTLVDNLGREYDCKLKRGDSQPETINTSVPMMERIRFEVICGRGLNFDLDVEWVKLSLKDLSTLPDTTWHIDVPR